MRITKRLARTSLWFAAVIGISVSILAWPVQARAAGFNLTISPLPISLKAKPGETVTTPLAVQNTGTDAVKLNVSLQTFSARGTNGEPTIHEPGPGDTYVNWVKFSKSSFIAEPGVMNNITMTIKVP